MTSAYDLPSVQELGGGGRESDVSPSGEEYVIAKVKFSISSNSLVSAVNHMAGRSFQEKKQTNQKNESFFSLNFNVFINLDKRETARARNK